MKKLYLVDVSSLFFRAFYAVRPLTSPSGLPTNAIYGFLSMILKMMKEENPEYYVFCYDRKEPSFRKEMYDDYKANRTEMPDDLEPQIPYIKKLADLLGIPSVEVPGYEADDLIGTLAKLGHKGGMEVYIVSGDKDFGQIVEEGIFLYDTMKDHRLGPKGVEEKWGIPPRQFIDYLALVGDSSDNVPGVKGIGPKGAQKLLQEFDTLEGIYANIEKITGSTKEKLIASKENAFLSQKLVTIVTDVKLSTNLDDYRLKGFQWDELRALLLELGFKNFDKTLESIASTPPSSGPQTATLKAASPVAAVKTKAQEESPMLPEKSLEAGDVAKAFQPGQVVWGLVSDQGVYLSDEKIVYALGGHPNEVGDELSKLDLRWSGFDLKAFWHFLGIRNPNIAWDSMLAHYVLKAGDKNEFSYVYQKWTGEVPSELPAGSELVGMHLRLANELKRLLSEENLIRLAEDYDFPLAPILYQMECLGIRLDTELLAKQSKGLATDIAALEKEIHSLAGESFNIASPKQLGNILFEKLKLPPSKKTKTGYSTDSDVLDKLKKSHAIIDLILSYRELTKLRSTYVDALPQLVKADGRIHTHFNQAHTMTGRLSSTDPNLQNIPIRTERGAQIRKAFVADPGKVLLSVDYSQIELRILAHYSGDENLIKAFKDDLDIHAITASEVFGIPLKDVTADHRRTAKAVNFGIAYGQGAFGLAEALGVTRTESADIIKRYFTRFPGVKTYIDSTIMKAKETGFVETLYGRKRHMDELRSNNVQIQKFGERAAINAPIQGTAADIVKKAMIDVVKVIDVPLLLQVHDELIFEGTEAVLREAQPKIVRVMESVAELKVPLKANSAIGPSWDEAH